MIGTCESSSSDSNIQEGFILNLENSRVSTPIIPNLKIVRVGIVKSAKTDKILTILLKIVQTMRSINFELIISCHQRGWITYTTLCGSL